MKVKKDHQDDKLFWVFDPQSGRGRWCTICLDGILRDTENSMFPEPSPERYQKAYKTYKEKDYGNKPRSRNCVR